MGAPFLRTRTARRRVALVCATALFALQLASAAPASVAAGSSPNREGILDALRAQLPAPPAGFSWEFFKDAVFLKPDGWHSQTDEVVSGKTTMGMTVFAESPEPFSATQPFSMGYTIQIISGNRTRNQLTAKQSMELYLKPFIDAHKGADVLLYDHRDNGPNLEYVFKYRDAPAGQVPIIVHKFLIVSEALDSVHVFTFESPEVSWKENWDRFGTPLLQRVSIINHAVPDR